MRKNLGFVTTSTLVAIVTLLSLVLGSPGFTQEQKENIKGQVMIFLNQNLEQPTTERQIAIEEESIIAEESSPEIIQEEKVDEKAISLKKTMLEKGEELNNKIKDAQRNLASSKTSYLTTPSAGCQKTSNGCISSPGKIGINTNYLIYQGIVSQLKERKTKLELLYQKIDEQGSSSLTLEDEEFLNKLSE